MYLQTLQQETKKKTKHSQKKSNKKYIKDKLPRTTEKDENTSDEEILKPTEKDSVNNGKRKMINECDHECPNLLALVILGVCCIVLNANQRKRKESMM